MKISGVHFQRQEARFLILLMCDRYVSYAEFIEFIWPDPDLQPLGVLKILDQYLFRIRRRIKPLGWEIIQQGPRSYGLLRDHRWTLKEIEHDPLRNVSCRAD